MRTSSKALIFRTIQVIWSPIALVGYILFVTKLALFSRRSGVSSTTLASLYTRWMQHRLGTRLDEPAMRLMMVLPNVSHLGLRMVTGGTLLAHRLTGYVSRIYRFPFEGAAQIAQEPAARTGLFDAALARHLKGVNQLVILGAGMDTRSYRMPQEIHCFEVDAPRTQDSKRQMLQRAGLDTTRITFVSADFLREDWLEKLVDTGFDPGKPSFFLWEGVTMYLDREAVESTLCKIASTASGSAIAFDYFNADLIEARSLYMSYSRAALNAVGEPLRFGIACPTPPTRKHVAAFLKSCGLALEEQHNFGRETERKAAMAGFVTATV